jgi:hypothetical protein
VIFSKRYNSAFKFLFPKVLCSHCPWERGQDVTWEGQEQKERRSGNLNPSILRGCGKKKKD